MNLKPWLTSIAVAFVFSCSPNPESGHLPVPTGATDSLPDSSPAYLLRNGKVAGQARMQQVYEPSPLKQLDLPVISAQLLKGLRQSERLLHLAQGRRNYQVGNLRIRHEELLQAIDVLKSWQHTKPVGIEQYLDAHQIWGGDRFGNVKFTGYFTPVIKVSRKREGPYQYPLYSRPIDWKGPLPTREEIEHGGVLQGQGLELAYADNKVDIYYMQVQGSGYVEYPDGSRELFAYNGTNRHPYRSIEKYLMGRPDLNVPRLSMEGIREFLHSRPSLTDTVLFQNPSYTFFIRQRTPPSGAGNVPLTADYSVAVDRRYIPLGSCLLAAFPVFDHRKQRVIRHDYRILLPQDVGGAIRGPGHIDFYTGIGPKAARRAGLINSYGQLWLLLPKKQAPEFISTAAQ